MYKIIEVKPMDLKTIRAFFKLQIDSFVINDCSYHVKDEKKWVNLPQREYVKDGERKYANVVWIPDKERYSSFQKWAVGEVEAQLGDSVPEQEERPF